MANLIKLFLPHLNNQYMANLINLCLPHLNYQHMANLIKLCMVNLSSLCMVVHLQITEHHQIKQTCSVHLQVVWTQDTVIQINMAKSPVMEKVPIVENKTESIGSCLKNFTFVY
jgi:hypothetical protein